MEVTSNNIFHRFQQESLFLAVSSVFTSLRFWESNISGMIYCYFPFHNIIIIVIVVIRITSIIITTLIIF